MNQYLSSLQRKIFAGFEVELESRAFIDLQAYWLAQYEPYRSVNMQGFKEELGWAPYTKSFAF